MAFPPPATETASQTAADVEISAEIAALCNATDFPALSVDQLAYLLKQAKRADQNGVSINYPTWIPTYNLNYAVYKGWQLKAGNAANKTDIADADQKISRNQVFKSCMEMANEWRKKLTGTVKVLAPQRSAGQIVPIAPIAPQILPTEQQQENA